MDGGRSEQKAKMACPEGAQSMHRRERERNPI